MLRADHPGDTPGESEWLLDSTAIQILPPGGSICGRLTLHSTTYTQQVSGSGEGRGDGRSKLESGGVGGRELVSPGGRHSTLYTLHPTPYTLHPTLYRFRVQERVEETDFPNSRAVASGAFRPVGELGFEAPRP